MSVYLYGKNPLKEALLSRPSCIKHVYLTKKSSQEPEVISLLQKHAVSYEVVTGEEIDHKVGKDAIHQGVAAEVYEKELYTSLDEYLSTLTEITAVVVLDHLQDPHNVGAIIRSSLAFNVGAVIIAEHDQVPITGTVIKSSSGAIFSLPIIKVSNINATLLTLKDKGFWIYGLTGDGDTSSHTALFDTHTAFVIGSEGEGIHKKTLEHCDFKLSIPINPSCESLNASNAYAVVAYEWSKKLRENT